MYLNPFENSILSKCFFTKYKIVYKSRFSSLFENMRKEERMNFNEEEEKQNKEYYSYDPFADEPNEIKLEDVINGRNLKTTVVVKNIPKKFQMKDLIDLLWSNEVWNFDVVYLPIKSKGTVSKKNLGFSFINFTDIQSLVEFYNKFQHKENGNVTTLSHRRFFQVLYCNTQGFGEIKRCYSSKYLYFNPKKVG